MALIEVVLLAGPAFAVGARRQSRSLALLAATGGTPPQARRVVLAGAVVLGGVAALVGVGAGIGAGRLLVPVLQARSGTWFGPFEVPWRHLAGIAAFGLASAVLAAAAPAWLASRQDVVAVLAGRRGDRKASLRSPILGVLLLGAGVAAAAYGASGGGSASAAYPIAGAAIVSVLGMVLLVPVVLVLVGRLARRLPLTLRYAARDAARHRSRTAPAVAAVAATVAGVVALGIAVASDEAQNAAHYDPFLAAGAGVVTAPQGVRTDWAAMRRVVEGDVPGAVVDRVRGLGTPGDGYTEVSLARHHEPLLWSYGTRFGADVLVSDGSLPAGLVGISGSDRRRAERALAAGGLVAFTDQGATDGPVRLRIRISDDRGRRQGRPVRATVPATVVPIGNTEGEPQAVVSSALADRLGLRVVPVGLTVGGTDISAAEQEAATEGLAAVDDGASFYVERGYVPDSSTLIIEWILFGLGAVLMLGGTLTATFLALSDARPDLATLAAVGAAPRTRRGVAASYATFVGVVGALLGVAVGFIPGVAITYPLTGADWSPGGAGAGAAHFLDVPWLLVLGLVVALPLLTAAVVGLCVRSRLPLVARLD
nr:FtsX-like permease family protein [Nocardioides panaciterrulae]